MHHIANRSGSTPYSLRSHPCCCSLGSSCTELLSPRLSWSLTSTTDSAKPAEAPNSRSIVSAVRVEYENCNGVEGMCLSFMRMERLVALTARHWKHPEKDIVLCLHGRIKLRLRKYLVQALTGPANVATETPKQSSLRIPTLVLANGAFSSRHRCDSCVVYVS